MNTEKIVLICICFFLMCIPMLGIGLCLVLSSPCVFMIDKRKNCCTLGKKAIWQKQYKMKPLCKLSEVKEAFRKGEPFFSSNFKLCLKLKSKKDVVVFSKIAGKIGDPSDFDNWAKEVNRFLNSKETLCEITQQKSFSDIGYGILCILLGCFALFGVLKEISLL